MNDEFVFSLLRLVRQRTLEAVANITEQEADRIPAGFNNNIRWNLGHILVITERLAFRLIKEPLGLPEELVNLFLNGTKPADWGNTIPDWGLLHSLLEGQIERIEQKLSGRLDEKLQVEFQNFSILEESLLFNLHHEGLHNGVIRSLAKAAAAETNKGE